MDRQEYRDRLAAKLRGARAETGPTSACGPRCLPPERFSGFSVTRVDTCGQTCHIR
jgi:hypothetical protein